LVFLVNESTWFSIPKTNILPRGQELLARMEVHAMGAFRFTALVCVIILCVWGLLVLDQMLPVIRRLAGVRLLSRIERVWRAPWFGYLLIGVATCIFWRFWSHLPPSGYATAAMAVAAVVIAMRTGMRGREKWLWFAILLAFWAVEIRAIKEDRRKQNGAFQEIADGLKAQMLQTIGSEGAPYFTPVFPMSGDTFPVKVNHFSDSLPVFDVNVDLLIRPPKGSNAMGVNVLQSIYHPVHYNIGTVLPYSIAESPITLRAPGRYYLKITTRHSAFYEKINIDKGPGGLTLAACLYRQRDNQLLEGKCD